MQLSSASLVFAAKAGTGLALLLGGGWLPLGFLSTIVASAACALRSMDSSSLSQSGTSVCSWLWRCHSNMVTESSFNSRSEVMSSLEGSWPRAFNYSVMEGLQLLSCSNSETGGLHNSTHMRLMNHMWTIVLCMKAFDCFLIMLPWLCESLNSALSCFILEGVLQVDHLFSSCKVRSLVDRHTKLVPKGLPLQDVSVEGGHF